jgi:hypothetical protein
MHNRRLITVAHVISGRKAVSSIRVNSCPFVVTTSFLGGSNDAGVPFPMNTNVNTHQTSNFFLLNSYFALVASTTPIKSAA